MHLLITLEWLLIIITIIIIIIVVVVVVEFTGYGGFAVVNTTVVVVVEKNISVLFKIEFYSNPVLNLLIFWMIMIKNRIDKYNSEENQYKPSVVIIIFKALYVF